MEEVRELINKHNLEEDNEYVIIPFMSADGKRKRCFLLKRRFIRIAFEDGRFTDYPLTEAIEATCRFPDFRLSEALLFLQKEAAEKSGETGGDAEDPDMDILKSMNR